MNDTLLTDTLVEMLSNKMQRSSVFNLTTNNIETLDSISTEKPFFNKGILILVYTENMTIEQLRKINRAFFSNDDCLLIFFNTSHKSFDYLKDKLDSVKTKEISFYKPPSWLVEAYLDRNSSKKYTEDGFRELMYRMRGQWKYLDFYVTELSERQDAVITGKVVSVTIPKYKRLDLDKIFVHLIQSRLDRKDFDTLYSYKYAYKFIMSELYDRIINSCKYKLDYIKGDLAYKNIEEYAKENKIQTYILRYYLDEVLTTTPLSYLYKWRTIIRKYKGLNDGFMQMVLDTRR